MSDCAYFRLAPGCSGPNFRVKLSLMPKLPVAVEAMEVKRSPQLISHQLRTGPTLCVGYWSRLYLTRYSAGQRSLPVTPRCGSANWTTPKPTVSD